MNIEKLYQIAAVQASLFVGVQKADRDDLVQEAVLVMLKAVEGSLDESREERSRTAYLKRTARNAMIDALKRMKRGPEVSEFDPDQALDTSTPFDFFVAGESEVRLVEVFTTAEERMSGRERSLFRCRLLGERDEALEALHSGTRGVYSTRARKKLSAVAGEKGCRDIASDSDFAVLFAR